MAYIRRVGILRVYWGGSIGCDVAYLEKVKISDCFKEVTMVRIYGSIFVFLGFVCGIAQIRADEMSVKVVGAPPETKGMRALFNEKDLTGWTGDARLWSVRDGVIHG